MTKWPDQEEILQSFLHEGKCTSTERSLATLALGEDDVDVKSLCSSMQGTCCVIQKE
jgi:hypothetical protein